MIEQTEEGDKSGVTLVIRVIIDLDLFDQKLSLWEKETQKVTDWLGNDEPKLLSNFSKWFFTVTGWMTAAQSLI